MSDSGPERRVLNYARPTAPARPRERFWPLVVLGVLVGCLLFVILLCAGGFFWFKT
jgi:hypothetical protein